MLFIPELSQLCKYLSISYKYYLKLFKHQNMLKFDNQQLETFLIQTQLVHQKVQALAENRMSPEQFDRLEVARAEDKKKRQQGVKRRQREAFEKKRQGREGKGITKDFQNFCRFCHRQYELPTPVCLRCNKNTMTLKERQEQLTVMVEEYKQKKKRREQRKMKWDMWQKTKAMLWKKTSNNYEKWEYFVSDSEQQRENQPIVPKDDPNFKALQRDMEERKARRMKDTKKAKQLKEKGNKLMKQGKYQQAKDMYTLALEHIKDIKSVYTNRALAYIKLGKYQRAIKDCTNVIEYIELFEKVQQNKDLIFKAYLRRSEAKKLRKQYKQALEDVNKALTFYPNDKSGEILKKQVEGFISYTDNLNKVLRQGKKNPQSQKKNTEDVEQNQDQEQIKQQNQKILTEQQAKLEQNKIIKQLAEAQLAEQNKNSNQVNEKGEKQIKEVKNENQNKVKIQKKEEAQKVQEVISKKQFNNPIDEIQEKINNLNEQNISSIFFMLKKQPELVNVFIASKGISKCLEQMVKAEQCKKQGFLVSACLRGDGVGEKEVWDFGIDKIYNRISQILSDSSELDTSRYFILEDIFEVLIPLSLHQKYRNIISEAIETSNFLEKTFAQLITKHKKQPDLFSSVLIYMGNLCSGTSKLRDQHINQQKFKTIVNLLYDKVISRKTVNRSHLNLKKNIYSLYANLVINQNHRLKLIELFNQKQLFSDQEKTKWWQLVKQLKYYPKSHDNFQEYILALLSVFANATLGTSTNIEGLAESINQRYLSNPSSYSSDIIHRSLLSISRIKYTDTKLFKSLIKNFSTHLQSYKKLKNQKNPFEQIVRLLNILYCPIESQPKFSQALPQNLLTQIKLYISSYQHGQVLFCNTCNLFCVILDSSTQYSNKLYQNLKPNIKFLIEVAKQKVGNWRKNSSILLAKLSINAQCKQQLYKHHGMDVLKSIAHFVKQK